MRGRRGRGAAAEPGAARVAIDWRAYAGRDCYGGLDLSASQDLTALVLAFPNELGGVDLQSHFWLPGEGDLEKRGRRDKASYAAWVRAGHLERTGGVCIDYDAIGARVRELAELYRIRGLAYDPQFAGMLAGQLYQDGNGLPMIRLPNTPYNLNEATLLFERLVVERKLRHDGNPVLAWCVANAALAKKGNLVMPSKQRSKGRIDGVAASVMALAAYAQDAGKADGASVYEKRGVLFL